MEGSCMVTCQVLSNLMINFLLVGWRAVTELQGDLECGTERWRAVTG